MKYAKMFSAVMILSAININAGKTITYGDLTAALDDSGKKIIISKTISNSTEIIKTIPYNGEVGAFTNIKFKNDQVLTATFGGGICPDHCHSDTIDYNIQNQPAGMNVFSAYNWFIKFLALE